jgi:hypothetical protein
VKLAFCCEHSSALHAIESANKLVATPDLETVGVALGMQDQVALDHFFVDPDPVWTIPAALAHDALEAMVPRKPEVTAMQNTLKTSRDVEILGRKNGSRIRTPPQRNLVFAVPGEDAEVIPSEHSPRIKIASNGEQSFFCKIYRREGRWASRLEVKDRHEESLEAWPASGDVRAVLLGRRSQIDSASSRSRSLSRCKTRP